MNVKKIVACAIVCVSMSGAIAAPREAQRDSDDICHLRRSKHDGYLKGAQLGDRDFPVISNNCSCCTEGLRAEVCVLREQVTDLQDQVCEIIALLHCLQPQFSESVCSDFFDALDTDNQCGIVVDDNPTDDGNSDWEDDYSSDDSGSDEDSDWDDSSSDSDSCSDEDEDDNDFF